MLTDKKQADAHELGDELHRAEYAIDVRRYDLAIEIMQRFLSTSPENSLAFYTIARAYMIKGEQQKAVAAFYEALRLNPAYSNAHALYGSLLKDMGQFSLAKQEVRVAILLDLGNALAHYIYANILLTEKKETDEAIQHILKALEIAPGNAKYHTTLGSLLVMKRDFTAAEAEYQRALSLDPEDVYAHNSYGVLLLNHTRDPQKALQHFRIALMKAPNNETIRKNLFLALKAKNKLYALFWNVAYLRRRMGKLYILLPVGVFLVVLLLDVWSVTAPLSGVLVLLYLLFLFYLFTIDRLFNFLLKRGWLK